MDDKTIQEIERLLTSFAQKQKDELVEFENRITKSYNKIAETPNMVNNITDDFFFDMNSKCAGQEGKEHFLLFGTNLKELMKQFKIVSLTASARH
jgi:hypothetical protein